LNSPARALKMLVDYQGMVNSFLKDRFFVQQTYLPLGILGAVAYNPFKLDIAGAKKLLAEAGYPNGFEVKLAVITVDPYPNIAQSMQQTMGEAGVKVNIVAGDSKQVIGEIRARKGQISLINWAPDYFDPHSNADWFGHNDDDRDQPNFRSGTWRTHWLIPELTKQTLAASRELDVKKREAMYVELQKAVTDDGPFIFMFQNKWVIANRSNVHGFKIALFEDLFAYRTVTKA
jgi:peptide/nickel transport system substrate-binding protein